MSPACPGGARPRASAGRSAPTVGYSRRSRLDKLGVAPGMRVALVGLDDPAFRRELRERTDDIVEGRPKRDSDMILFAVDGTGPLQRLTSLRRAIRPEGAIWTLWPKGQPHIKEDMIRRAAIAQGLVDIKVMAFSQTLSGLKLVIPRAQRPATAARPRTRAAPRAKAIRPRASAKGTRARSADRAPSRTGMPPTRAKARTRHPVETPIELRRALPRSPKARAAFEKFPPSHRREVIGSITEAKKPETRERRSAKTVAQLEQGWPTR